MQKDSWLSNFRLFIIGVSSSCFIAILSCLNSGYDGFKSIQQNYKIPFIGFILLIVLGCSLFSLYIGTKIKDKGQVKVRNKKKIN